MRSYPKHRLTGFTLIEMIVYIGILLVVATGAITLLLSLDSFADQYKLEATLYRSGTSVMEQILVAARDADQFDAGNSVLNNATGTLAVSKSGQTTRFSRLNGQLRFYLNGVDQGNMLASNVTVTNFTVYRYTTAVGNFVRVRLSLTANVGSATKSITLYNSAVIRGDI